VRPAAARIADGAPVEASRVVLPYHTRVAGAFRVPVRRQYSSTMCPDSCMVVPPISCCVLSVCSTRYPDTCCRPYEPPGSSRRCAVSYTPSCDHRRVCLLQTRVADSAAVPFVLHCGGVVEGKAVSATPRFGPADYEPRFSNVAIRCVLCAGPPAPRCASDSCFPLLRAACSAAILPHTCCQGNTQAKVLAHGIPPRRLCSGCLTQ